MGSFFVSIISENIARLNGLALNGNLATNKKRYNYLEYPRKTWNNSENFILN